MANRKILGGCAVAWLAFSAGCTEGVDPNVLAGTAIGAGLGMAVSSDDDKVAGALVGAGLGAALASAMTAQGGAIASGSSAQPSTQVVNVGGLSDQRTQEIVSAHNYALQAALDANEARRWSTRGASGSIYPIGTTNQYGLTCRDFDSLWNDGGSSGKLTGRACRQPDGYWKQEQI